MRIKDEKRVIKKIKTTFAISYIEDCQQRKLEHK